MNVLPAAVVADPAPPAADAVDARLRTSRRPGTGKLVTGGAVVCLIVLAGVFAPLLTRYGPLEQNLGERLHGPSWDHWFGTDEVGRDVFSRCLHAIRIDLVLGLLGAVLPAVVGTALGALAGYVGRWLDVIIMRIADAVQAFPFHIFLIALVFALGAGPRPFVVAITAIGWVAYARLMRAEVLRLRRADFVAAAHLAGFSHRRVLFRHLIPNAIPQTVVYLAGDIVVVLITLSAVSFFGLGVQPPEAEWGQMIATGAKYLQAEWWMSVFPGVMIVVTGIGFTLIADGLDDRRRAA